MINNFLTTKEYWQDVWSEIELPARFFYNNYANKIIVKKIKNYISKDYKLFLEIGGCPGRWSDYFFLNYEMVCDSIENNHENIKIIEKNYKALNIDGDAIYDDIIDPKNTAKKYDIVLSDGLLEHFNNINKIFENHLKFLNNNGLLIISVPNIKKSKFYNFFAKLDKVSYQGYRNVSREELKELSLRNNLKILYCDYLGVFNIGLINSRNLNIYIKKVYSKLDLIFNFLLKIIRINRESSLFSPYIYLVAIKNEKM